MFRAITNFKIWLTWPSLEHFFRELLILDYQSQTFSSLFRHFLFLIISSELTKINTFYSEKLAEATRKFATLKSELASAQEPSHKSEVRLVAFLTENNLVGGRFSSMEEHRP
jgi:hypothetical protein